MSTTGDGFTPLVLGVSTAITMIILVVHVAWSYRVEISAMMRKLFHRYLAVHYVAPAHNMQLDQSNFRTSQPEVEAEVEAETRTGSDPDIISLTTKALQLRIDEATNEGMIRAYAALAKGGYLPTGKATEIKKLLFEVSGGRALQRLNAAIDAVVVPAPASAPLRATPVAGRPVARGQRFAGELFDDALTNERKNL